MNKLCLLFLALWVATVSAFAANQEEQPTQEEESEEQQQPSELPRVLGQARTEEEYAAWEVIQQAPQLEEKAELTQKFLEEYPESGFTPWANHILARSYLQNGDYDKFVEHAEEGLREMPDKADLAIFLALEYAERDESDKAIELAQSSLQIMQDKLQPSELSMADWTLEKDGLMADCHYALGRSYMTKYVKKMSGSSGGEDPNLEQALEHLEKACALDPEHERAYYRLGFLFAKQNVADQAVENYARAAALGGITSDRAASALKKIHDFIRKIMPDSELGRKNFDELIATEREFIQGQIAERQAKLQELREQEAQQPIPVEALP